MTEMTRAAAGAPGVVFLCVHNAGRSQMATGRARALGGTRLRVYSVGSEPAAAVNPRAVEAMREAGIDITSAVTQAWTDEVLRGADVVVTMGCGDSCPVVPSVRYLDWELEDPAGQPLEVVRRVRDDTEGRVRGLPRELGGEGRS